MIPYFSWNLFYPYALMVPPALWTDEFVQESNDWLSEQETSFLSFGFFYVFRDEKDRFHFVMRWS